MAPTQGSGLSLVKTKIVATVGPASADEPAIRELIEAGVDIFRLNFAHGTHEWLHNVLTIIRKTAIELDSPIGVLGDLSGPKIRLGQLPEAGVECHEGALFTFGREPNADDPNWLTCTYKQLIDDVNVGDRVLLADGMVAMRATEKTSDTIVCKVEQSGRIRSRQGVNLPGVALSTPSLTEKDRGDLKWALDNELDFVGLSFVRSSDDVALLRGAISEHPSGHQPFIISKIEKTEAVDDIEAILDVTDAIMVARGDLGVEADITQVPILQKKIINLCNQHRVPVITATQMLDSMQENDLPTRAEATDMANAVIDRTDAVMLSGETAIGAHPARCVRMMDKIAHNAEELVTFSPRVDSESDPTRRALPVTEAVAIGAVGAATQLNAKLIVIASRTGRTAMAFSKQRCQTPIIAVSGDPKIARRMCLFWGVTSLHTDAVAGNADQLTERVDTWGRKNGILVEGDRMVLVTKTKDQGHDMMLIHSVE